ncbi:DUF6509 family protein [Peribacillus sp. FSL H8-0477]|jgi:hypothetical protein|uniref:DUF6509 family protein n=1 Tax=Peribacillus sp. FSL H8-0477 TaxID=2921388 RepID=UPI004046F8DF
MKYFFWKDDYMLTITGYKVEKLKDPFDILTGDRYELFLDIEVPEDDELASEKGLYIRVLYVVDDNTSKVVKYDLLERETEQLLEFDLEDDELAMVAQFCKEHLKEEEL